MGWTKEERAAYDKSYRLANKEKRNAQNKDWHLANKEKANATSKAWRLANPEEKAAYKKAWYLENKEKQDAYNKAYLLKLNLINKNISRRTLSAWSAQVRTIQSKCMTCGSSENLHAHHIAPKSEYPKLALLLLNGITLCKDCHIKVHATPV